MNSPAAAITDRTVHARLGAAEIVRYDRAGKWYVEDLTARRQVTLAEAAELAREWREMPGGTWHPSRAGGQSFDRLVGV